MNQPCILEYSHTRCLSSSPFPLLQRWISWARKYQGILSQDFVTLSLTTSCVNETKPTLKCSLDPSTGIDAIIHHGSPGIRTDFSERAMVMVWNPSQVAYNGSITGEGSLYHSTGSYRLIYTVYSIFSVAKHVWYVLRVKSVLTMTFYT